MVPKVHICLYTVFVTIVNSNKAWHKYMDNLNYKQRENNTQ